MPGIVTRYRPDGDADAAVLEYHFSVLLGDEPGGALIRRVDGTVDAQVLDDAARLHVAEKPAPALVASERMLGLLLLSCEPDK